MKHLVGTALILAASLLAQTAPAQPLPKRTAYVSCIAYTHRWKTVYVTNVFPIQISNPQDQSMVSAFLIHAVVDKFNLSPPKASDAEPLNATLCNGPGNENINRFTTQEDAQRSREAMLADARSRGANIVEFTTNEQDLDVRGKRALAKYGYYFEK